MSFINDTFKCKETVFGNFSSFEYLGFILKGEPQILLLTIYRPPGCSDSFMDDFSDLLATIPIDYSCIIITGEFNIHTDNNTATNTKELFSLLWVSCSM